MIRSMVAAALAATMACAGAGIFTRQVEGPASGHWDGAVEREGWWRPLSLDLEQDRDGWRGGWRSRPAGPSMSLEGIEVRGDEVRFEAGDLRFVGRVTGETLSGSVIDSAGRPVGSFSVTRDDPGLYVGG